MRIAELGRAVERLYHHRERDIPRIHFYPIKDGGSVGLLEDSYRPFPSEIISKLAESNHEIKVLCQQASDAFGFDVEGVSENPERPIQRKLNFISTLSYFIKHKKKDISLLAGQGDNQIIAMTLAGAFPSFNNAFRFFDAYVEATEEVCPQGETYLLRLDEETGAQTRKLFSQEIKKIEDKGYKISAVNSRNEVLFVNDQKNLFDALILNKELLPKGMSFFPIKRAPVNSSLVKHSLPAIEQAFVDAQIQDGRIPLISQRTGKVIRTKKQIEEEIIKGVVESTHGDKVFDTIMGVTDEESLLAFLNENRTTVGIVALGLSAAAAAGLIYRNRRDRNKQKG